MRTVVAFLLAPLAPAAVAALLALAPSLTGFSLPGSIFFVSVLYGYPLATLFGVPAYWLFRRKGWLKLWQVVLAGAATGAVVPLALYGLVASYTAQTKGIAEAARVGAQEGGPLLLFGIGVGCLIAFVFWLIAIAPLRRRGTTTAGRAGAA